MPSLRGQVKTSYLVAVICLGKGYLSDLLGKMNKQPLNVKGTTTNNPLLTFEKTLHISGNKILLFGE
jgi:hypothetical protein